MINSDLLTKRKRGNEKIIALAGNPNVGKSTIFNALTGLNHHTGNWPGKTVTNASGSFSYNGNDYVIVDLPGCYSLVPHSAEEEVARDFICFGNADLVIVVCDAVCLERNLNLVLQTIEITNNVIVCVNLLDEARKKNIVIDIDNLSKALGVPIIGTEARSNKGLDKLLNKISAFSSESPIKIKYPDYIENTIELICGLLNFDADINKRWIALKLLENDNQVIDALLSDFPALQEESFQYKLKQIRSSIYESYITAEKLSDDIIKSILFCAESICSTCVKFKDNLYNERDRKIDKILTGKYSGFPIMLLLLGLIFWITIKGANYPSQLLSSLMLHTESLLISFFDFIHAPEWVCNMLVFGVFRVLGWVISVMLPPMAIFFPMFTLLEDLGYLPRIAFNLDNCFRKCSTCGKQALTMSMGFGCNAVGVTGCRIIDSPRERMIAILTNSFVPCNGRFPTIISLITIFFAVSSSGVINSYISVLMLLGIIILGVIMTLIVSKLLSKTIFKGKPSSFTLELPPYRVPLVGKVIVRSILDRTIFVLGRAIAAAAPAGLIIWLMANITIGDYSILHHCSAFIDPFARFFGLDGVILLSFILGFPANEIVLPIIIMSYLSGNTLNPINDIFQLKAVLIDNGWTWVTALCTIIFSLFHWPCAATLLTIKKETQSKLWAVVSFALPTCIGLIICAVISNASAFLFRSI